MYLNGVLVPLQDHLRGCFEQDVQPSGINAVLFDHVLRRHTVVFGLASEVEARFEASKVPTNLGHLFPRDDCWVPCRFLNSYGV